MNEKDYVIERLKMYTKKDVIITTHAEIRMFQRQITKEEVVENIINPFRLEIALREGTKQANEEKFDCYFGYSKTQCQRYLLLLKKDVVVITVIKINRRWQAIVEKKLKK